MVLTQVLHGLAFYKTRAKYNLTFLIYLDSEEILVTGKFKIFYLAIIYNKSQKT